MFKKNVLENVSEKICRKQFEIKQYYKLKVIR